ncbi:MAG: hypothetical protein P4L59_04275 [Desulfosporosinus sp.]|nr:hypothetical protein [Desulfosporosinus sp.]
MIPKIYSNVTNLFTMSGWEPIPLNANAEEAGFTGIFTCGYGTIGLVIDEVNSILSCWVDCQAFMSELRENQSVGVKKDLYLVFIVPRITENSVVNLQSVVNDTYVCRKICIEQGERTPEESLMDIPFLKLVHARDIGNESQEFASSIEFSTKGLSKELLTDLVKRSKGAIIESLLEGKYKEVSIDEN